MVDWVARITDAAAEQLEPGETVLGGAEFTATAFAILGTRSSGGFLGLRRPGQPPEAAVTIPRRGVAVGVTQNRLLVYGLAGFGRITDRLAEFHLDDVVQVVVREVPGNVIRVQPPSASVRFVLVDGTEVSGSMVSAGPAGRANSTLLDGLAEARPGLISR